MMTYGYIFIDI